MVGTDLVRRTLAGIWLWGGRKRGPNFKLLGDLARYGVWKSRAMSGLLALCQVFSESTDCMPGMETAATNAKSGI
jgi:hypothetical protein